MGRLFFSIDLAINVILLFCIGALSFRRDGGIEGDVWYGFTAYWTSQMGGLSKRLTGKSCLL